MRTITDYAEKQQKEHEALIQFLKTNNYNIALEVKEKQIPLSKVDSCLSINEINQGVILFLDGLNLANGSVGGINIYRLLQTYLLDIEKRNHINEILTKK